MSTLIEQALEQAKNAPNKEKTIVIDGGSYNFNSSLGSSDPEQVANRLRALQSLRDQNLISAAEYEAKRAEILRHL